MNSQLFRHSSPTWLRDRLLTLVGAAESLELVEVAAKLLQRKKLLDFTLAPGKITAKVQDDSGQFHRTELLVAEISELAWNGVFQCISKKALWGAALLAGEYPEELEDALKSASVPLVPTSEEKFQIVSSDITHTVALILRFYEFLEGNPFALFTLRGRGREESLLQIRQSRHSLFSELKDSLDSKTTTLSLPEQVVPTVDLTKFWELGAAIQTISYNIRADELPASILRRHDPLPIGAVAEDIEHDLEEAYAQVARRAQAYGLSFG